MIEEALPKPVLISNHQSNVQIIKDFTSNLISSLSSNMFAYGLGLMLLDTTHSPISFGLNMVISPIVYLLCLVPVGNIVDKYRHKKILSFSLLGRLLILALLAFTINLFSGFLKLIPAVIFVGLNAVSLNFTTTAYQSSVHELVNTGHIQKLSSLSNTATNISNILGPVLGVVLYAALGFETFVLIEILATIIAFSIMTLMSFHYEKRDKNPDSEVKTTQNFSLNNFKVGFNYIKNHAWLKIIIFFCVLLNFLAAAPNLGISYITKIQLHLGNTPVAFLDTALGIGLLFGSLFMSMISDKKGFVYKIFLPILVFSVSIFLLGFVFNFFNSLFSINLFGGLVMTLFGFSQSVLNIAVIVKIQKSVSTKLLGRVISTMMTADMSAAPLGIILFTPLFKTIANGSYIFIASGIILMVFVSILSIRTIPIFIKLEKNKSF